MVVIKRRTFVLTAFLWSAFGTLARGAADDPIPLTDAVGVLGREKSAAEQYAVILATVGRENITNYLRGITLYADAKAEFDGLITQLRFNLREGHDPSTSDAFRQALRSAAEKRVAFTTFITNDVIGEIKGAKPGLPMIIGAAPDLIKAITEAGLSIWAAFRNAAKEKQDAILDDLEHLKWRSFAELAPR